MANTFYNRIIRKLVVGFGNIFNDITLVRYNPDFTEAERMIVPIIYAPKELYVKRLEEDPTLGKKVQVTLPRMSFEIIGYNYDPSRKVSRMQQITCGDASGSTLTRMYSPVPYNIDLTMYVITKTQEDGLQIIEQILPTFTPEYTLKVNYTTEPNVVMDVPIILNSVSVSDEYDGDFQTRRFVTHTLNFQMKTNVFGPVGGKGVIETAMANIGQNEDFSNPNRLYTVEGDITNASVSSENWLDGF